MVYRTSFTRSAGILLGLTWRGAAHPSTRPSAAHPHAAANSAARTSIHIPRRTPAPLSCCFSAGRPVVSCAGPGTVTRKRAAVAPSGASPAARRAACPRVLAPHCSSRVLPACTPSCAPAFVALTRALHVPPQIPVIETPLNLTAASAPPPLAPMQPPPRA